MSVSVCIGIYNGEQFIKEQLLSILHQTRQPDEVILCDDHSQDGSLGIVREFIHLYHLENRWHLYQNETNKGYPGNYYHAMELCTGDIVFLGDQDDVWGETKLERMLDAMAKQPGANVMACKFGLINGSGKPIHTLMAPSHSRHTRQIHNIRLPDIFYKYEWPGMALSYRNQWYRSLKKPSSNIPHDIFICAKAAEDNAFFQLDETLAYHRRHSHNTAAEEHRLGKLLQKDRKLWEIETYIHMLDAFRKDHILHTAEGKKILTAKNHTMRDRYSALQSGKISIILKSALQHHKNTRLATVLCDLVIAINPKTEN